MPTKRQVLDLFSHDDLLAYADRLRLAVPDRHSTDALAEALNAAPSLQLDPILLALRRPRLQEMCRSLGLDDSGREKSVLVQRIGGEASGPVKQNDRARTGDQR